jgi:hypothetical protein
MVVHACHPRYVGSISRNIEVQDGPSKNVRSYFKNRQSSWAQLVHTCNLATQEAEVRRIMVRSQPGQIVHKTLSRKYPSKKGWQSGSR